MEQGDVGKLQAAVNRHGYAFHYAVIRELDRCFTRGNSRWILEAVEFPVAVQQRQSHIDIVLTNQDINAYLVIECKRVNPAYGSWAFFAAPYSTRNEASYSPLTCDVISKGNIYPFPVSTGRAEFQCGTDVKQAGVAVAFKKDEKGEPGGSGSHALTEVLTQVSVGTNGLLQTLHDNPRLWSPGKQPVRVFAVVITTAELYWCGQSLADSSLATGDLTLDPSHIAQEEWLWVHNNMSPALRTAMHRFEQPTTIGDLLQQEFRRSVAIVNVKGIGRFLRYGISP